MCKKKEVKNKKPETLAAHILEMAGVISFKFGNYADSLPGGKLWFQSVKGSQSYVHTYV